MIMMESELIRLMFTFSMIDRKADHGLREAVVGPGCPTLSS